MPPDRFPRRRGDGPPWDSLSPGLRAFPPQARGWTLAAATASSARDVSPAGAGMDLERGERPTEGGRFPRRRGDGPQTEASVIAWTKFPPQARGWTIITRCCGVRACVSPAGAGMDLILRLRRCPVVGFPRRRGDGPRSLRPVDAPRQFPPQARGWTGYHGSSGWASSVSPAGAGMDLMPSKRNPEIKGFPRRRGDGPQFATESSAKSGFPPQARGWTPGTRRR